MALAFDTVSIRNAMLDTISARAGSGALIRIYDSTGTGRPASGAAVTTQVKLAELVVSGAFAAAASGGVLTVNAITADSSADATGTATWFRVVQSGGTNFVMDGNVGTSGSDLNLNTVSLVTGANVSITSFTITAGNA